jgi:hypothetical protein
MSLPNEQAQSEYDAKERQAEYDEHGTEIDRA